MPIGGAPSRSSSAAGRRPMGDMRMHEWKKRLLHSLSTQETRLAAVAPDDWSHLVAPDGDGPTFFSRFVPARPGVALAEVFGRHAVSVEAWLDRRGALLFRGFNVSGPRELELLCRWIGSGACESREETSPRSRVVGSVYTATEYPAQYPIAFHNESSYQSVLPGKLLFLCIQAPHTGGATMLADCRAVWRALPDALRQSFAKDGYRLIRTYHPYFGLSWQRAFGVDDPAQLATLARRDGIVLDWKGGDALTTTQMRPCVATHPRTGERCWTNHMYFFHHANLPDSARLALSGDASADYFVNETCRANGAAIEADVLTQIARAYETNAIAVDWQPGDVLLVDNISVAHGRSPYAGARELYFAQTDPVDWAQLRGTPELIPEKK
ncbi:TauD/TfdA family dioxygenase [Paraburkholderia caledonica]|uniref:Alpha-ketoglutarate-dependent taurine dioxygenase n=1 Tax=Paraburkholderia caledonica TaxID=134536 RepID=A0AB73IIF7_9BURK|nr:alpha-ketoglutarate-dependent taurine dioxygenase [Paraburkholderia caledonica]